jgi:predicted acetyltransferase
MTEPFLTRPIIEYQDSVIAAFREFEKEGRTPPWHYDMLNFHFDEFVETLLARETDPQEGLVPQTDYWLIADGEFAGEINIRHALTESLERFGGHIGYRVRPSMRKKGYGTLQLQLVLPYCWAMGLERVLITCDDDNIGSYKIIEANGGVLLDKIDNGRESLTRRYWISKPSGLS